MRIVLDAGAMVGVDRGNRAVASILHVARREKLPLLTSSGAVAQVWRNGARQASLARLLAGIRVESISPAVARTVGLLLGASGTSDIVDAHVALLADPGDLILTSDPSDIARLTATRRVDAVVQKV